MNRANVRPGDELGGVELVPDPLSSEFSDQQQASSLPSGVLAEPATRAKQRAKQPLEQNRIVIVTAGAIVAALLIFAAVSMPHKGERRKAKNRSATTTQGLDVEAADSEVDKSLFPIIDSGRAHGKHDHEGFLSEQDLQRTVTPRTPKTRGQANDAGSLGSITPFANDQWQPSPYQPTGVTAPVPDKGEQDSMGKSSLIYVNKTSAASRETRLADNLADEPGLGLATGTRLRAHLESAASTAVRTPVLAVIDYNYEADGQIVVPAGAKAVGHIRDANRSGYLDIEFDSLVMPDGADVPIEAAATDLDLRPLRGRVEGKNTGKNILVRSLSGIGQAGSLFIGQNSLNQPLSESDLIRERVSSNIGEAGDEEISRMAVAQRIVVTVPAGVPLYVVIQRHTKERQNSSRPAESNGTGSRSANIDQLRELLQLRQELNSSTASASLH